MITPNKKTSIIPFASRYAALVNLYKFATWAKLISAIDTKLKILWQYLVEKFTHIEIKIKKNYKINHYF